MKQKLLKTMLLLCALVVGGASSVWADSAVYTFNTDDGLSALGISKPTAGNGTDLSTSDSYDVNGISMSVTNGTTNTRIWNKSGTLTLRIYSTGTITFSASGSNITEIAFTGTTNFNSLDGWDSSTKKWSGTATSVTFTNSSTQSQINTITVTYSAPTTVSVPTFSVAGGTYNTTKSVELSCGTTGATIYYTTNGDTPTTSSSIYSTAIAVNQSMTIKAIGVKDGLTNSAEASATYTLKCVTPSITIPDGAFVSSKEVTITSTDGATIRYTTDGITTPTTSEGSVYDSENKPSISATTTVKAIAYKDGWSNSDVQSTTFTKETVLDGMSALVAKTNTSDQSYYVNLTDAQVTYVYGKHGYMEDGSAGIYIYNMSPTLNKVYNGIFQVTYQLYNSMPELKAISAVEGTITDGSTKAPTEMTASDLSTNFTANLGRQIQITGHTVETTTVLITGINYYTTYYDPSFVKDNVYTIIGYPYNNNGTLQYRVISAVEKPDAPTFDPATGEFSTDFDLTINAATGSAIYYTIDGSTPTASSTEYDPDSKPTISAGADVTVKAIAVLAGMTSSVGSATYEYKAISKPTFDPVDGTSVYYGETIALSCDVDGSTIYYTTDGSTPTSSSSVYSEPIVIDANSVTIKAKAKKGDDWSSEASATFTLKDPAEPTFSIAAGAVPRNTVVTISSAAGTTIYYTTNGDDADTGTDAGSNSVNVTIDDAKTIKAIAVDPELNMSSEVSAAYTILQVATPTFATAAGSFLDEQEVVISCATDGASIYYTTNGDTPTTSSTEYTEPFVVTATTTIKAIAVKSYCVDSEVSSITYTKATVHTVAEVISGDVSGSVYVQGYIVGEYVGKTTNPKTTGFSGNSNIAIADAFTDSPTASGSIPVQLSGSLQTAYGLKANGTGLGKRVIVYGSAESYFSVNGIKSTSSVTTTSELANITSAGYATYASTNPLDFTGKEINAYIAEANGTTGVTFTQIYKVPANTGVLLYYSGGAIAQDIPVFNGSGAEDTDGNVFIPGTGAAVASEVGSLHNYILNNKGGVIGFYRAADQTVAKNRAYIQIDESTPVKGFIALPGSEETAVEAVKAESEDGVIFNLAGQRVSKLQRGINIINGKKVVVK